MSKYQKLFLLVIALAITAGIISWQMPLVRGLDIAGGMRVILQVAPKSDSEWSGDQRERAQKMDAIRKTIQARVMGFQGVSEAVVRVQNPGASRPRLIVEIPGIKDHEKALDKIRSTAALEFYYLKDLESEKNPLWQWKMSEGSTSGEFIFTDRQGRTIDSKANPKAVLSEVVGKDAKPILTGKDLNSTAKATLSQSKVVIEIEFTPKGTQKFADFTTEHVGEHLAIFFDGKLMTAPNVREPITTGKAEISGFANLKEAKGTAEFLNAGALPVPLKVVQSDTVEPTLGLATIRLVVFAGIVGLLLVVIFMLLYYRLPGAIADIALCLYTLFVIAAFKAIHVSMSLAGVAALIISIGMAVDANILIFERLKEELRSGKTLRSAIDAGFNRAFTAIFDSNMCTAITCAILMAYGTPSVKSFALTLLVGVIISMFTAITVTRTILHLLVGWEWAQKPELYGLSRSWFASSGIDIIGKRAYYFIFSAILLLPGLFFLATSGLNKGIEFRSGTEIEVVFDKPADLNGVRSIVSKYAPTSQVQLANSGKIAYITTDLVRNKMGEKKYTETVSDLRDDLAAKYDVSVDKETNRPSFSESSVEPAVSREIVKNAFLSVLLASVLIVLYLTIRFAIGGVLAGLKYGVCAVIALIHDAAFILGLFAILGKFLGWEVDSLFVTAVLTIIGFSVHDTIVVFDRIRENLRHRQRGESFEQLANRSILQTFSRSINTSLTVVLTLGALVLLGGPQLRHFYVALLAGIIIGTYSSIFNATPLVVVWDKLFSGSGTEGPKSRREAEGKALVTAEESKPVFGGDESKSNGSADADAKTDEKSTTRVKRKKRRF